jgi:hypothetical protein
MKKDSNLAQFLKSSPEGKFIRKIRNQVTSGNFFTPPPPSSTSSLHIFAIGYSFKKHTNEDLSRWRAKSIKDTVLGEKR